MKLFQHDFQSKEFEAMPKNRRRTAVRREKEEQRNRQTDTELTAAVSKHIFGCISLPDYRKWAHCWNRRQKKIYWRVADEIMGETNVLISSFPDIVFVYTFLFVSWTWSQRMKWILLSSQNWSMLFFCNIWTNTEKTARGRTAKKIKLKEKNIRRIRTRKKFVAVKTNETVDGISSFVELNETVIETVCWSHSIRHSISFTQQAASVLWLSVFSSISSFLLWIVNNNKQWASNTENVHSDNKLKVNNKKRIHERRQNVNGTKKKIGDEQQ